MISNNAPSLVLFCCILTTLMFVLACGAGTNDLVETEFATQDKEYLGQGVKFSEQVYSPHISEGQKHPPYNSKPATSGWHHSNWVKWGVYEIEIPDEYLVHNLEHGGVGIHYNCLQECMGMVEGLSRIASQYDKIVVSPYSDMDSRISLTSWTYKDSFEQFDEDRITAFIKAHIGKPPAPEYSIPP